MTHDRRASALVVLAALILMNAGCGGNAARRQARVPVVVAKVEQRSVPYEIEATGTVEPMRAAAVTARVGGLVTRIPFREGDHVAAGQVLIELDRRPFQAAVDRTAALLARDRAQAQSARLEFDRAESLAGQQLISVQELEQKRAAYAAAEATARADSADLVNAQLDLAHATVRAPISGRTGDLTVNVGEMVRENGTQPLVTINQVRPILVRFAIPQSDLPELQKRQGEQMAVEASIAADDSVWSRGLLVFIDNAVDAATGTVLLKGEFANTDGDLWPGAFVRARLNVYEQADAVVVPTAAVSNAQSGTFCYVVQPDTTVEVRPIKVQREWREWTVIDGGLTAGETVVTDGQLRLSPGAKAFIRNASGSAGSDAPSSSSASSTSAAPNSAPAGGAAQAGTR
jgi:membrane fusion protein, multidrug efflux system